MFSHLSSHSVFAPSIHPPPRDEQALTDGGGMVGLKDEGRQPARQDYNFNCVFHTLTRESFYFGAPPPTLTNPSSLSCSLPPLLCCKSRRVLSNPTRFRKVILPHFLSNWAHHSLIHPFRACSSFLSFPFVAGPGQSCASIGIYKWSASV